MNVNTQTATIQLSSLGGCGVHHQPVRVFTFAGIRIKTLAYATNAIYDNIYFQYRQDMLTEDQWRASLN